ncbi:TFIIH basal transcription factor complex TTD-A subunit [Nematocida sp. AWRm80]|nr:TFIIH basal transcription factor complex TTD-A subunit [Nematocida sp. AWRm80]
MVKAIRGTLIECDPSIKQIILRLNREYNFIIQDLDDTLLFVDQKYTQKIEEETSKMIKHIVKKNLD